MIKYRLLKLGVEIILPATSTNDSAIWEVKSFLDEPLPILEEVAHRDLLAQYGVYGHLITRSTTPLDLAAAMQSPTMQGYKPELIEGAELVQAYNGLPEGALT